MKNANFNHFDHEDHDDINIEFDASHTCTLLPSATSATIWATILQATFGRGCLLSTPQGDGVATAAAAAVDNIHGSYHYPPDAHSHALCQGVCEVLRSQCWRRHSVRLTCRRLHPSSSALRCFFISWCFTLGRYWRRLQRSKWPLQSFTGVSYRDAAAAINSDRVRMSCVVSAQSPWFIA
jgi:hypothetical protein